MRATYIYGAGDIRVETVADPELLLPTDAIVRVTRACICGSDLHPYHSKPASEHGTTIGHEFIGVVEEIGSDVATLGVGDFVIAPFAWSDGTCAFCREGLQTSCEQGGFWNMPGKQVGGGQAEAVRVPLADGTLVKVPAPVDEALYPSLLALTDVYGTGWHAALRAGVNASKTIAVIGDGAVGLMAVLSAKQMGAERIILMGRHETRTNLGLEFGATDVVAERGDEGIQMVRELTDGYGVHAVLEAVGMLPAYEQALGIVRPGGVISRVGVPQYEEGPVGSTLFFPNITLTGGPAPVRTYIEQLLPGVLDGTVNPGKVFDQTIDLDHTPEGYRAMDQRTALKVMVTP
ncbi:zinc-dependent alcohol dehydrogenase family protein [Galbitalea soli]|uniref:Zinc-dependent alcohol dehydrogenase family protein n=1 Tax=Galbitalea soli TaxID=1268042 RepID=A0A7C9TT54_9MICO|nr:zinc-dependent alcohol dehydrogenase family protein [Galbitalea soli]NEM92164.1 zinc-dependent alcohol dehydrogenase family protein [Galbitalea soli]